MPQFDTIGFFSQIFWLTFILFTFYIIVFKNYLPKMTRVFKVRRKKLELGGSSQGHSFDKEKHVALGGYNNILSKYSSLSQEELSIHQQKLNQALRHNLSVSGGHWDTLHTSFLTLVGKLRKATV